MQDAHIPAAGHQEGVQLTQEQVEIGRRSARELERVPVDAGIGHGRNPPMVTVLGGGGQEGRHEGQEEEQSFHHLPICCWTTEAGSDFRRS